MAASSSARGWRLFEIIAMLATVDEELFTESEPLALKTLFAVEMVLVGNWLVSPLRHHSQAKGKTHSIESDESLRGLIGKTSVVDCWVS